MDYYKDKIYIAKIDKDDTILEKVERWEAHREGILHRAFSVGIFYQGQIILQHRKHPVFNNVLDFTVSSHQMYVGDKLQEDEEAVYATLTREFNIEKTDLVSGLEYKGKTYYSAKDEQSEFMEHEVCRLYACEVKTLPQPNLDFAYGSTLVPLDFIKDEKNPISYLLNPWVKAFVKAGLI